MMKVRKGFTLVELLIVIVIIGILAAAMLLSSGAATASAEASNIINDLRSMKAAALMLYADSMDDFNSGTAPTLTIALLKPYVDNPSKYDTGTAYDLTKNGNKWWVGFDNSKGKKTPEVLEKLQGRAKSVGLLKTAGDLTTAYTGGAQIWMVAR